MKINLEPTGLNITLAIIFIVALIVFAPLLSIWSLNTLFSLSIPYDFYTWVASLWLGAVLSGGLVSKKS